LFNDVKRGAQIPDPRKRLACQPSGMSSENRDGEKEEGFLPFFLKEVEQMVQTTERLAVKKKKKRKKEREKKQRKKKKTGEEKRKEKKKKN